MSYQIHLADPSDAAQIDSLLDRAFGYDRTQRTVYRLREGLPALPELSFVARHTDGGLLASIQYWPVLIERTPAILLGPLAVEPALQGQGYGKALVRHSLSEAKRLGHRLCVVVGAPDYYAPFGFVPATPAGLLLPGPVELPRFQVLELQAGALEGVAGLIGRPSPEAEPAERAPRRA
jgi:predicted N-acetyltransferase YhbS